MWLWAFQESDGEAIRIINALDQHNTQWWPPRQVTRALWISQFTVRLMIIIIQSANGNYGRAARFASSHQRVYKQHGAHPNNAHTMDCKLHHEYFTLACALCRAAHRSTPFVARLTGSKLGMRASADSAPGKLTQNSLSPHPSLALSLSWYQNCN